MSLNSNTRSLLGLNYENIDFANFMKNSVAFSKLILYFIIFFENNF